MSKYIRLTKGLFDKGQLISPDKIYDLIDDNHDWFVSTYNYNEKHLAHFKEHNSIKGIRDVTSTNIWLDFDHKENPELAQADALESVNRLLKLPSVTDSNIEIYFTGSKGFHVILNTNKELTPTQIKSIAINNIGKGLKTFDTSLYDSSQLLRVPGTKHKETKLYKIPLTYNQLQTLKIDQIKTLATSLDNIKDDFSKYPADIELEVPEEEKKVVIKNESIDWSSKPKNWKNCKWSLLQGDIPLGKRHEALLILASTCKALGNSKDMAYDLVKGALRRSIEKHGQGSSTKEEAFSIVEDVYDDFWQGGQYTCKEPGFLQNYCNDLGEHKCNREKEDADKIKVYEIKDLLNIFDDFVRNFDKNRIMTGIKPIDDKLNLTIGQPVAILAAPSVGKTSLLLNILSNNSQSKVHSMFFSLDMYNALITQKLLHKHTKMNFEKLKDLVQNNPKEAIKYYDQVENNMKYMHSVVQSGISVAQMKQVIQDYEKENSIKVKIVAVDYLELIGGAYSDETANSAFNARALKDLANDLQVSVIVLTQPQKTKKPDEPITSYRDLKGASLLEQSFRIIIGMYRPGFSPDNPEQDKFIGINCVKNTMGPLFSTHLKFDGLSGSVSVLNETEWDELNELQDKKKEQKEESDKW